MSEAPTGPRIRAGRHRRGRDRAPRSDAGARGHVGDRGDRRLGDGGPGERADGTQMRAKATTTTSTKRGALDGSWRIRRRS